MPITTTFHDFVASKIQAAWRRALDRRAFLERRRAVVVIQSRFRRNARREKVRVSVRAFSSGEATTRPKTEASLEPSPTRARASPRLRSRERTTPRRDTTRGGVRRRLQNLSRPNADSTTGSVEHALTHHSPRPALHARLTRALLASLITRNLFTREKPPQAARRIARAWRCHVFTRAYRAARDVLLRRGGLVAAWTPGTPPGPYDTPDIIHDAPLALRLANPAERASGGRPRRVRPRAPEAGRASRGNAASRAVFAAERVLPRVHAPPGGRPQRSRRRRTSRTPSETPRRTRGARVHRSRVWNTRARNPDGFRTRTRTRRIDTCVSSATTGALYPREPRERWPRTSACRRRRRSRPCPGFLILGAARLSTAKAPRRESSRSSRNARGRRRRSTSSTPSAASGGLTARRGTARATVRGVRRDAAATRAAIRRRARAWSAGGDGSAAKTGRPSTFRIRFRREDEELDSLLEWSAGLDFEAFDASWREKSVSPGEASETNATRRE